MIYLVPLIAVLLGYDAIVGEQEGGLLELLLSMPITRLAILLGKYLGLSAALAGAIAQLDLHDNEAIGASGNYQRYFMADGKRHPHIIDPRSGGSIDQVAFVTIIASGGADPGLRSDGNSRPLFIAGPKHWKSMARRLGLELVMLLDAERNVEMTPAMRARMVLKP